MRGIELIWKKNPGEKVKKVFERNDYNGDRRKGGEDIKSRT